MSEVFISDGLKGVSAQVDNKNRLSTKAVTFTSSLSASMEGDQYNVSSAAFPVLTDDAETPLMYLLNDETDKTDWAITEITIIAAASTDGVDDWSVKFFRNPTAGTIITAGADAVITNLDVGSNAPLSAMAKVGATGQTLSGGSSLSRLVPAAPANLSIPLDAVIMGPGEAIGVAVIPPTGNSSMKMDVAVSIIRLTE